MNTPSKMTPYLFGITLLVTALAVTACPTAGSEKTAPAAADAPLSAVETVETDLTVPWEIAFLPGGDILVTERTGTLVRLGAAGRAITVPGVETAGESGLMSLALHPAFAENRWLYLAYTTGSDNRVVRYTYDLEANALTEPTVIIAGIPAARFHDGGRIAFGPDGYLYVTTGDAGDPGSAQDPASLAGKILRLTDGGDIPGDNPFGNAVYSYGHRNPQGLAWDDRGRLWSTEHGRSVPLSGYDELNLIEKGKNYGWPVIQGDEAAPGMVGPVIHSGPATTWAPAGAAYSDGAVLFTGLKGETLYRYDTGTRTLTAYFAGRFGRMRAVAVHDGWLYLSTSNRDGRGTVKEGDDRIVRIRLDYLMRQ